LARAAGTPRSCRLLEVAAKAIQIDILRPSLRRIVGNLAAAHLQIRSLRATEKTYTSIIVLVADDTREGATP
jgi:hypothetical protein